MSLKEDFLMISTYEEYDRRRDEFITLDIQDKEIFDHWSKLFPTLDNNDFDNGIITEVYKKPRK